MAEKKNLVIKVKYPTGAKTSQATQTIPAVITVWNVQRIGLAIGGLIVFIILLASIFSGNSDTEQDEELKAPQVSENVRVVPQTTETHSVVKQPTPPTASSLNAVVQTNSQTPPPKVANTAKISVKPQAPTLSKEPPRVRRAMLASSITDKEPGNEIAQNVSVPPTKLTTVYYFNELRGMNGKIIYHEWLRNGVSVVKEPLQVSADRWRVSSHKTFDDKASGNWTVKLIDDTNNVLNEKSFTVSIGQ
ncbi:MAG: DUF2914 domain-containing protein [Methylovulum sp.]|nr:DUF2914 domain-containing protein [Methylovulum sp.]